MPLDYTREGKIATFTFNRPDVHNAIDLETLEQYHNALVDFRDDPSLWVGIITGAGSKAFCAGSDLKTTVEWRKGCINAPWRQPPTTMRGLELWKPLIAAVNGMAIGGGLELALSCDMRIAAEHARFGLPEVKLGLIPGWGGTSRLPHLVPWAIAAEMLFTGKPLDAQAALRVGLINRVVPAEQLMDAARAMASAICDNGPLAVRAAKQIMTASRHSGMEEALKMELQMGDYLLNTRDFEAGVQAFHTRSKPVFQGK